MQGLRRWERAGELSSTRAEEALGATLVTMDAALASIPGNVAPVEVMR